MEKRKKEQASMTNKKIILTVSALLMLATIVAGVCRYAQTQYEEGYDSGRNEGYDVGYDDGHDKGYDQGMKDGYKYGYHDGFRKGRDSWLWR